MIENRLVAINNTGSRRVSHCRYKESPTLRIIHCGEIFQKTPIIVDIRRVTKTGRDHEHTIFLRFLTIILRFCMDFINNSERGMVFLSGFPSFSFTITEL